MQRVIRAGGMLLGPELKAVPDGALVVDDDKIAAVGPFQRLQTEMGSSLPEDELVDIPGEEVGRVGPLRLLARVLDDGCVVRAGAVLLVRKLDLAGECDAPVVAEEGKVAPLTGAPAALLALGTGEGKRGVLAEQLVDPTRHVGCEFPFCGWLAHGGLMPWEARCLTLDARQGRIYPHASQPASNRERVLRYGAAALCRSGALLRDHGVPRR